MKKGSGFDWLASSFTGQQISTIKMILNQIEQGHGFCKEEEGKEVVKRMVNQ